MERMKAPDIFNKLFVPQLHQRFFDEIESTKKVEGLIKELGGSLVIDHGATRTPDPKVYEFITRLAGAFGLKPHMKYNFPGKKLTAVDLQFEDKVGFKWFLTLVEYEKFSPGAAKSVKEDIEKTNNVLSEKGMTLLEKLEKDGELASDEAKGLVDEVMIFLKRQGPPVKKSTLDLLAQESSEVVNALLMGPDFNHIAYLLNGLNIKEWYGQEIIDVINELMSNEGFKMLPEVQGKAGGILRQTSIMADDMEFEVEESDGKVRTITSPGRFIELIQRGAERDESGKIIFEGKNPQMFMGFVSQNTEKLYESTNTKFS